MPEACAGAGRYCAATRPPDGAGRPCVQAASVCSPGLTVVAAAARNLHVIATPEPFAAPGRPRSPSTGEADGLSWALRFLDPVVLPCSG